jgi:hypothetical protein
MSTPLDIAKQLHILLSYVWEDATDPDSEGIAEIGESEAGVMLDLINELIDELDLHSDE